MRSKPGNASRGGRLAPLWLRALFVFVFADLALAQTPVPQPPPVIDKRLETTVNVPDSEKTKRSAEMVAHARLSLKEVLEKLEEARNSRDVLRLNCVSEKLTQIKGLLRVLEGGDVALQEAIVNKDSTASEYEYTKELVAYRRLMELRADVEQCIGQLAYQTGAQSVEVIVPDNLAGDDITNPSEPPIVLVRPPPASPM